MNETTHYVMLGYDISSLAGYIRQLELDKAEFIDGIPEYSLNRISKIGYEPYNKNIFGIRLDKADEYGTDFDKSFTLEKLSSYKPEITAKFKQFLFDYFKVSNIENFEFKVITFSVTH